MHKMNKYIKRLILCFPQTELLPFLIDFHFYFHPLNFLAVFTTECYKVCWQLRKKFITEWLIMFIQIASCNTLWQFMMDFKQIKLFILLSNWIFIRINFSIISCHPWNEYVCFWKKKCIELHYVYIFKLLIVLGLKVKQRIIGQSLHWPHWNHLVVAFIFYFFLPKSESDSISRHTRR